jgi:hypothetical protein
MSDDMKKIMTDDQARALNSSDPYNQIFKVGSLIQNLQKYCQWLEENSSGGGGGGVSSVNGRTGAVTLDKTDVGLSNADNTADVDKPVSTAQQAALNSLAVRIVEVDGVWDNVEGIVTFVFPSNCVEAFVYVQMGTSYTWDWHIPYTSGTLPIALKQTSNQTTNESTNANKLYCTLTTDGTKASVRMNFSGGIEPDVMKMVCVVSGI